MYTILQRFWNFEFRQIQPVHYLLVAILIFAGSLIYVAGEVLFGLNAQAGGITIKDVDWQALTSVNLQSGIENWFPFAWISLALFSFVVRVAVIIHSYFRSKRVLGNEEFSRYLLTYFSSFVLAAFLGVALMFAMLGTAKLLGFQPSAGVNVLRDGVAWLQALADTYIPTLINVESYGLAILLTLFLSALPGYFVHWLSHKSRFFWYVFHRCHHCPQFLHPMGAPPAFSFDFVLVIPSGLMAIAISKLIYTEPLVMEMGLWFTFAYTFEIFNHSIVHYDFAYRNFFVRNMSRLIGDRGVYHLMHHSAKPNDQTINLGASPFLFWDRLF
ncbi:MAG: sterol desaturase family protein, partial [Flavobacteriales bacterium]